MGRDDGFPVADIATGLLDDDKVRRLWHRLGDRATMCEAITIHMAVLLGSWGAGRRVSVDHALPVWLEAPSERIADLQSVGLLDRRGMIPVRSWGTWFGPAEARREARREAGRRGGIASGKQRSSNAEATLNPSGRQAGPSYPSNKPSYRASGGSRRNGAAARGGPTTVGTVLEETEFQQLVPRDVALGEEKP